ncbi:hypothetical protein [Rheinheimera sp.]|uniref:hypothetical protein n=1 Tax=Rheinheimera sp. TaxID=1869214 RepID=UPI004047DBFA
MIKILKYIAESLYRLIRRCLFCKIGMHGSKIAPDGKMSNVCCWGCGHIFNLAMYKTYLVTLNDGQEYKVRATNEYHACSVVVYGYADGEKLTIDANTGKPNTRLIKVHRNNIKSARQIADVE